MSQNCPFFSSAPMSINLLTIDEVAALIGVSRVQVCKYLDAQRIPYVELGGRRFVERRHAKKPTAKRPGPKPKA